MSLRRLPVSTVFVGLIFVVSALSASAGPAQDGAAFYKAGRYKEALDTFEKAWPFIQSDPNSLYYYAITAQKLGHKAKSNHVFKEIVTKFPDSAAAVHCRQALGLPPLVAKRQASVAAAPSGTGLPYNCPVSLYPGAQILEHTDRPANTWDWKEIRLQAVAAPERVLEFYENEMARNSNWTMDEKTPVEKQRRAFKDGKKVYGFVDYKNNDAAAEYKNVSISVDSKDVVPNEDTLTDVEIHLWVKHRR